MTRAPQWNRRTAMALAAALWAVLFLPGINEPELQGEEGRRILPAIDMLQGGNWIVPSVGGEQYFNKPPGINWIVAAAFTLTGQRTEWSARLPSAIFILAFVLLLIGKRNPLLSTPARLTGSVVFMTAAFIIEKGRLIEIEAIYTSLTGMAVVWWLGDFAAGDRPWRQWLVPALLLAFGALIKGPFLAAPFYAVVICVLARTGRLRQLFSAPHVAACLLILAIDGGWLLAARAQGAAAMGETYDKQLGNRFTEFDLAEWPVEIVKAIVMLAPWVLFTPILWMRRFTAALGVADSAGQEPSPPAVFAAARRGAIIGLVLLCLMPGFEARYVLPAWPGLAVLLGWVLAEHRQELVTDRIWRRTLLAVLAAVPLVMLAMFLPPVAKLVVPRYAHMLPPSAAGVAMLVAAVAIAAIAFWRKRLFTGGSGLTLMTGLAVAAIVLAYVAIGLPIRTQTGTRRDAAAKVNSLVPAGETIHVYDPGYQSFLFYIRQPLRYVTSPAAMGPHVRYLLVPAILLERPSDGRLRNSDERCMLQLALHERGAAVVGTITARGSEDGKGREVRYSTFHVMRLSVLDELPRPID